MPTITLRDVPEELHGWLKKQAKTHHRSVNKEVIALLETLRGCPEPHLSADEKFERLMAISRRCAVLPILDHRSEDEILGYDENGIPG